MCYNTKYTHALLTLHQTLSDTSLSFEKLQTVPEPHTDRLEKIRDMRVVILHEMSAGDPSQILSSCVLMLHHLLLIPSCPSKPI